MKFKIALLLLMVGAGCSHAAQDQKQDGTSSQSQQSQLGAPSVGSGAQTVQLAQTGDRSAHVTQPPLDNDVQQLLQVGRPRRAMIIAITQAGVVGIELPLRPTPAQQDSAMRLAILSLFQRRWRSNSPSMPLTKPAVDAVDDQDNEDS